ncbi:MAG: hypothetical protein ACRDT4_18490 [Micromonosporaceae bacterium]
MSVPAGGRCGPAFAVTGVAVTLGESPGLREAGAAAVGRAPEEPDEASGRGVGRTPPAGVAVWPGVPDPSFGGAALGVGVEAG